MNVFGGYARYYDLLYRDKDYAGESAYAAERLRAHAPGARDILELGCGSGLHAMELARMGYHVTGIDISEPMLDAARERLTRAPGEIRARLLFRHGDARSCRLGVRFDAVIALFHVMSYQTSSADVDAALATAAAHLGPGAPFVFDFWYGPAVLAQRPEARVKQVEDASVRITRTADPRLREEANCVDVRYTLQIERKQGAQGAERLSEEHTMRYFFLPEIELALARSGLRLASAAEMGSGAPLSEATWSACAAAVKL
ncbi:MAG: class I SAM-dependent DNA methyltransferase [Steroidobacteraceae bacterium]